MLNDYSLFVCVDLTSQAPFRQRRNHDTTDRYSAVLQNSLVQLSVSTLFTQEVVDDYTFECEVGGQAQRTKVSIYQSMGDPLVYGKIYCAKEPKAEEDNTDLKLIHPP